MNKEDKRIVGSLICSSFWGAQERIRARDQYLQDHDESRVSPSKMKGIARIIGSFGNLDGVCSVFLNSDIQCSLSFTKKISVLLPKLIRSPTSVLFLVYILRASFLKKNIMLCACVRAGRYLACVEDLIIYCTLTYL